MYALTTLFDLDSNDAFSNLWQGLREACGLQTANQVSFVHLSWQGALGYQLGPAHEYLKKIASNVHAFTVKLAGIGVFTGKEPVLYLNVVKSRALMDLHELLWEELLPHATEINAYYSPKEWVPHVTLVYGTLLPNDLRCAIGELMYVPLSFELEINNLALIFLRDGSVGIDSRFELHA